MRDKKFIYNLHINNSSAEDTNEEQIIANDDDGIRSLITLSTIALIFY